MIRWTERSEGYVVRASLPGTTVRGVLGFLLMAAALMGLTTDDFTVLLFAALPGVGLLFWAWREWSRRAWLFVPVHGKGAGWGRGEPHLGGSVTSLDRFDLERVPRWIRLLAPHYRVVGIQAGGQKVEVLHPWRTADAITVDALVKQLNDLLQPSDQSLAKVQAPELIDAYAAAARRHLVVLVIVGTLILAIAGFLGMSVH